MTSILELFGKLAPGEHRRRRQFERICKWFLENDHEYKRQIKRVWLWDDWPGRWGRDKGIDLVAETFGKKYWAVQSKAYALNHSVTKNDIDRFLSESSRKSISYRLLISTAAELGHNAKEVIQGQEKPVGTLLFSDLKNRKLNWPSSPDKLVAKQEKPKKPRRDQERAIADVVLGFQSHPRGQLIRACGTGKTLIGLRVAEAMKSQRTLVLVPSLSLVSQVLSDWTKDSLRPFRFLPVCSDETIGGEDHLVSRVSELGVPATTDSTAIAAFLRGSGTRVIFSTYQSSPKIALAFKQHKLEPFDLVIADEAHRCAGVEAGEAATILDSQQIRARKRLFMTATPRIASESSKSRADSMGLELVSMDDQKLFGPVFHELKFSDAIRLKLLTDYRVEIIGVDDPLYRQYAEQGVFVTLDGKTVTDARNLTSHIAVAKAIKKYDLRRIITFHGRVARAREFADQFPQFIRWMPTADIPSGEIWSDLISGDMASNKRDAILDRLREVAPPARGVVTNARCLSEGIDVRALDGVAFIDPKESQVDIIQAVGRAIRKAERKKHGIIILPVYISSGEDEEKTLEDSSFKQVWRVLRALRSHDDQLACELDNLRTKLGRRGKVRANLPAKINVNLPTRLNAKFADAFYLRTVRAITQSWRPFEEARAFTHKLRLKSSTEWIAFIKGQLPHHEKLPSDIPAAPHYIYAEKGWKSYGDWLGTGTVATHLRQYRPFHRARAFARRLKLNSQTEWTAFCKGKMPELGKRPADIPALPHKTYADKGWKGMGDWLGTGNVANFLKKYRPFREARAFVRRLKLGGHSQWRALCKGELPKLGRLPNDIPANPNSTYSEDGWKSYGDWLGTGTVATHLRQYRPFRQARAFVRRLKLHSEAEWVAFARGRLPRLGKLPADIPVSPYQTYADKGWKGMGDWLGTGTVAPRLRKYRPFLKARTFSRSLKLKSGSEWRAFCNGDIPRLGWLPKDIPTNPHRTYAEKGWKGMGDWLGTDTIAPRLRQYRPFRQARAFARSLKLKSWTEWSAFCKGMMPQSGRLPVDIPASPEEIYALKGWKGMGDWLGTGTVAPHLRKYRSFRRARAFAISLKLKSANEWRMYCKGKMRIGGKLPVDIPASPHLIYYKKGWKSWGHWLGTGRIASKHRRKKES